MAVVEARPCLRGTQQSGDVGSGNGRAGNANEASPLKSPGFAFQRHRRKRLVIGDKRFLVYPRYRSSITRKHNQGNLGVYSGLASASPGRVCAGFMDTFEPAEASAESATDCTERTNDRMCETFVRDSEMKPEWKLVKKELLKRFSDARNIEDISS